MEPSKDSDRVPLGVVTDSLGQRRGKPGRKRLKMLLLLGVVTSLLVVVITVPVAVVVGRRRAASIAMRTPANMAAASAEYCANADDIDLCRKTVMQGVNASTPFGPSDLPSFPIKIIDATKPLIIDILAAMETLRLLNNAGPAAEACNENLKGGSESLTEAATLIRNDRVRDAQILLAAVRTFDADCADELLLVVGNLTEGEGSSALTVALSATESVALHLGNALALAEHLLLAPKKRGGGRKLVARKRKLSRRRLLAEASKVRRDLTPDFTVSKTGSADFSNITSAVYRALAKRGTTGERIVIKVLQGVYAERVVIPKELWGLTMIGEGSDKTRILFHDFGTPPTIAQTYSFAVEARGFLAVDLTFENNPGMDGRSKPAVAVRVSQRVSGNVGRSTESRFTDHDHSGMAAFVSCGFQGYHSTLYAHSGWQYYYDCDVAGTEDYISGNAAAVFDKCTVHSHSGFNGTSVIAVQGRTSAHEPTGFVFRQCAVEADSEEANSTEAFLGRPQFYRKVYQRQAWKPFSRTVFQLSTLGRVRRAGWQDWQAAEAGGVDFRKTVECYEYRNSGPGSVTSARVGWSRELTNEEARRYTPESFVSGNAWLPDLGIPSDTWQ